MRVRAKSRAMYARGAPARASSRPAATPVRSLPAVVWCSLACIDPGEFVEEGGTRAVEEEGTAGVVSHVREEVAERGWVRFEHFQVEVC